MPRRTERQEVQRQIDVELFSLDETPEERARRAAYDAQTQAILADIADIKREEEDEEYRALMQQRRAEEEAQRNAVIMQRLAEEEETYQNDFYDEEDY